MKICGIICEYNPFHFGHEYQLREAQRLSGADAVICFMSGNFVQRGEASVLEKHVRARHAVLGGADAVIELPTCFATSSAEIFAKGAIHLLSSIPELSVLCFGAESATASELKKAATLLLNEPKEISEKIQILLSKGISYAKARAEAWKEAIDPALLTSPNNILALEYTKAILSKNINLEILPIQRQGSGYLEKTLSTKYPSATAIREAIHKGTPVYGIADYVKNDLPTSLENGLDLIENYAILNKTVNEIAQTPDCTEGLEYAFKNALSQGKRHLAERLTSARYTTSRIRRILLQNMLNITKEDIKRYLQTPLYLNVLAVKKSRTDLLSVLGNAKAPLIIRAHDEEKLSPVALQCFQTDIFAERVYSQLYPLKEKKEIFIEK